MKCTAEAEAALTNLPLHKRVLEQIERKVHDVVNPSTTIYVSLYTDPETETSSWMVDLGCSPEKIDTVMGNLYIEIAVHQMPLIIRR